MAPKQGGILQSSGFLTLKSLMSLHLTCKANAFDELSLILLIENELTRHHRHVKTVNEAIDFWKRVYYNLWLKQWFVCGSIVIESEEMMARKEDVMYEAVRYEVMLDKMLRTIPESQRANIVIQPLTSRRPILHSAARAGYHDSIHTILSLVPAAERLRIVSEPCSSLDKSTVLHLAAASGNLECVRTMVALYPESERFRAVWARDICQHTVLFMAAASVILELIKYILTLFPESEQRLQIMEMRNVEGETALHFVARTDNIDALQLFLNCYPRSKRLQASCSLRDQFGKSVMYQARNSCKALETIMSLLPESDRLQAVQTGGLNGGSILRDVALLRKADSVRAILSAIPEDSQRLQAMSGSLPNTGFVKTVLESISQSQHLQLLAPSTPTNSATSMQTTEDGDAEKREAKRRKTTKD